MRLTGPGGVGHGKVGPCHGVCLGFHGGMAGRLPNQLITSHETVKVIEDSHLKTSRAEKIKEEKADFVKKKALAEKRKNECTNKSVRGGVRGGARGGKCGRGRGNDKL